MLIFYDAHQAILWLIENAHGPCSVALYKEGRTIVDGIEAWLKVCYTQWNPTKRLLS